MVLKLYYERYGGELDRFRDYCEIREFQHKEFGNERALFLSGKDLVLYTFFAEPLYAKRDQRHLKPFLSNLVRACILRQNGFQRLIQY